MNPAAWIVYLGAAAIPSSISAPAHQFEVTVIVVNTCALPRPAVDEALSTAKNLFAPAGIKLRFSSTEPEDGAPDTLWVRLMPHAPHEAGMNTLGAAVVARLPRTALIFCDRVKVFAATYDSRHDGLLLGFAIAHELGHIFGYACGHTATGLMKAAWKPADIPLMMQGAMRFSKADLARFRMYVDFREREQLAAARLKR